MSLLVVYLCAHAEVWLLCTLHRRFSGGGLLPPGCLATPGDLGVFPLRILRARKARELVISRDLREPTGIASRVKSRETD
jgi:hypothetical protein